MPWASLVQMVKNQPAMQETWVQSLGWKDPLEEGMLSVFNHITQNPKKSVIIS